MYKVLKPKGTGTNVSIENTDTLSSIIIGRLSKDIVDALAGTHEPINAADEWSFEVNKETADKLAKLAMKMKKPIRDQRKQETKKDANKKIDAMDVLLGLANYN